MNSDKLSIFGLGYVGGTAAICFKELGYTIYGVDIDKGKQKQFKHDINVVGYKKALDNTDVSFICVPTPCKKNGDIDLSYVETVCKQISEYKPMQIVVMRSTVFPNQIVKLEKMVDNLVINPEFLREATADYDFMNPPFIIVGSKNIDIARKVMNVYNKINTKKYFTTPEEAQMIKYVCNVWHACKISFTNEIGNVCNKLDIDGEKIMDIFKQDTKLNISTAYHRIGEAFGGHCLPKDLSVFIYQSQKIGLDNCLIESIYKSNKQHITYQEKIINDRR